jgi:hypothetical protein
MRHALLLALAAALAPSLAGGQPSAPEPEPRPHLSVGFATMNQDGTMTGDVEARYACPGATFETRFTTTIKKAEDPDQALVRARPYLLEKFQPFRTFCASPPANWNWGDLAAGTSLERETMHLTSGYQGETGVSGAVSVTARCPTMTTELRASFAHARTKQEAADQARPLIRQQLEALAPFCR